jgi:hypothetical protein
MTGARDPGSLAVGGNLMQHVGLHIISPRIAYASFITLKMRLGLQGIDNQE